MFRAIDISGEGFESYEGKKISHLGKVNLFVGQNNSGKSRLIRKIFSARKLTYAPKDIPIEQILENIVDFNNDLIFFTNENNISIFPDIRYPFPDDLAITNLITTDFEPTRDIYKPLEKIENELNRPSLLAQNFLKKDLSGISLESVVKNFKERITNVLLPSIREVLPESYTYKYDILYIPTLRGFRPLVAKDTLDKQIDDYYTDRTIQDYFQDDEDRLRKKIYSGLTFYEDVKKHLLGRHEEREKVAKFESFLGATFFKGANVTLIPRRDSDVIVIKVGDSEERKIYNLGDGIQAIILLTYPLFFNRDKNLKVFIEEPELYLHPGMQRILLDAFTDSNLFPMHQFFISTHSNHFLDMTADFNNISIYSLAKKEDTNEEKFIITNLESADSDVLNLLGVKNSSVFLSNCTIWVEGITDRLYLRKYLEIYFRNEGISSFKEDIHYSFVEYGGGNITHWSFLEDSDPQYPNINVERLCGMLFLITDQDGAGLKKDGTIDSRKKRKYERHLKLQKQLGNSYYCLKSREIENLLSPGILKEIIKDYERSNFENLEFKNWNQKGYSSQLLGNYINKNVIGIKRNYADESGTIKDKVRFAKKAISSMKTIDDLSEEAIELCKKLHNFIETQNQYS